MDINNLAYTQTVQIVKEALARFAKEDQAILVQPHEVELVIGCKCLNKNFNPTEPESDLNSPFDVTNTEPYYYVTKKGEPYLRPERKGDGKTHEVRFTQILGVKHDLTGKGYMAKKYITTTIQKFAKLLSTDPRNIEIVLTTPPPEVNEGEVLTPDQILKSITPIALLFDNGAFIKQLDIQKDLFAKDDKIEQEILSGQ